VFPLVYIDLNANHAPHSNRRLDNRFNIFEGLTHNWFFIGISALMCGGQVLIIFVGGAAFSIAKEGQSATMWVIAIVLGFLSIPFGIVIRLIPDSFVAALIPEFLKRKAKKAPGLSISDEEMGKYPEPLADVRDELKFLRRMKGGRLNNLKFAIQHPRETIKQRRSPSHSRSNSILAPQTPVKEDKAGSGAATPDSRRRSKLMPSRSNSALGAPTVMAGLVAAGVAANWSPVARTPTEGIGQENGGSDERVGGSRDTS
jgi:P-type Ca2+ transporter type 2C